ncbi:MAG TPA: hypothetical protein VFE36_10620 [Candidatus Baltobacteraceae bacterium]|jgi:hypothetical protein|nr:hypothetical protein [Candidatus Baltobacteraceae bacterium]
MSNVSGISGSSNSVSVMNAAVTVATNPLLQQSGPFSNLNLTPAQQSQLQQDLQGRHHHHHHGGGGSSSIGSDGTEAFGIPSSISAGSSTATHSISDVAAAFSLQAQLQSNNNE